MPFLNVVYGGTLAEIKTNDLEDISELQDVIKAKYKNALAEIDAPQLQLYKSYPDEGENSEDLVTDLEDIPEEYFKKRKDGGLALEIRTSPGPSTQSINTMRVIRANELMAPQEISVSMPDGEPPFTARVNWLNDSVSEIESYMNRRDTSLFRIPPMAFVRCSRGGKTRALLEIAIKLKSKRIHAQSDRTAALRRRIAFAALKDKTVSFESFCNVDFPEKELEDWLGSTPCVLLVDELNLLDEKLDAAFSKFVKKMFLVETGRYFVYSSHIVTITNRLASFMDSQGNRTVLVPELPLVPSLAIAKQNFDFAALTSRDILYYGCIPGILAEVRINLTPTNKRGAAVQSCIEAGLITDESVRLLLSTFITGDFHKVPGPLLYLMDSFRDSGPPKVKWIPHNMIYALERFAVDRVCSCSETMRLHLRNLTRIFSTFHQAKEESGDAWEPLFVFALYIRCILCLSDHLLSIGVANDPLPSVSYNKCFVNQGVHYSGMKTIEELVEAIPRALPSQQAPHIAIYYPPHARFQTYDVIVVVFREDGTREKVIGYQLKEGKKVPTMQPSPLVAESILFRGLSAEERKNYHGWIAPSDAEIDTFFGESGKLWTPKHWKQLAS